MKTSDYKITGTQEGVTLFELLVAMLILVLVSAMLYSVLNSSIKFSEKGESRIQIIEQERSFLDLMRRQVHGIRYDIKQKKLQIFAEGNLLKMVTSTSIIERDAGMVLAIYVNDPGEGVLYYTEKVDFYNVDYQEDYQPSPDEMIVLMRDVEGLALQYEEDDGTLKVTYAGREYELFPRSWQGEEG